MSGEVLMNFARDMSSEIALLKYYSLQGSMGQVLLMLQIWPSGR